MGVKLDAEEQAILDSVEAGEWQSKGQLNERVVELQAYLKQEKKKQCPCVCLKMTYMS